MNEERADIQPNKHHGAIDEPLWTKNDIVRHKSTGHPYLVVHVYHHMCTILLDLEEKSTLALTYTLRVADYESFARDIDMQQEVKKNEMIWAYKPLPSFL